MLVPFITFVFLNIGVNVKSRRFSRRSFIANSARATGGVITLGMFSSQSITAGQELLSTEYTWNNLNEHQGNTIELLTQMIMPSDENGPGASEAQVVVYIDRALGTHRRDFRESYIQGLTAFDKYCLVAFKSDFVHLSERNRRRALMGIDRQRSPRTWPKGASIGAREFLRMIITHTMEGMFCDPSYGGNYEEIGWKLIRFPGRAPFGYDPPFSEFDMDIPEIQYPAWNPYNGPMKSRIIGEE